MGATLTGRRREGNHAGGRGEERFRPDLNALGLMRKKRRKEDDKTHHEHGTQEGKEMAEPSDCGNKRTETMITVSFDRHDMNVDKNAGLDASGRGCNEGLSKKGEKRALR